MDLDAGALVWSPYSPDGAAAPQCHNDGECDAGVNGRCFWTYLGSGANFPEVPQCSYDTCFSDQDCPSPFVCDCRDAKVYPWTTANRCLPSGNCRVDSDCASGFCSPTPQNGCGEGYFCHTAQDTCSNDSDCPNGTQCAFFSYAATHWECMGPCLDGGV